MGYYEKKTYPVQGCNIYTLRNTMQRIILHFISVFHPIIQLNIQKTW